MDEQKKEIMVAVGSRIKYLRHAKEFSQEDLALRTNLNPAYFGQVERGLKCPTIDTLYKIAKALEVPVAELLKTDVLPDYPEDYDQRIKALLAKIPANKREQVFQLIEDISTLF